MKKPPTSTAKTESRSRWSLSALWAWFTPSNVSHKADLLEVFAEQNRQLIRLLEKQHTTLDRIVLAKFDTPVQSRVTEQRQAQPMFPEYMLSDVLAADSDEEFQRRAEQITQ